MKTYQIPAHLRSLYTKRILGIDRCSIWLDTDRDVLTPQLKSDIEAAGAKVRVKVIKRNISRYEKRWKQVWQILQPSRKALDIVAQALRDAACDDFVNNVELAIDWIIPDDAARTEFTRLFRRHFIHKTGNRFFWHGERDTRYYAPTTDGSGKRGCKKVPVDYPDRPSKMTGEPCHHFEYRLFGSAECRRAGIFTVSQLASYDILEYFKMNARFAKMPSKYEVGKALSPRSQTSVLNRRQLERDCDAILQSKNLGLEKNCLQRLLSEFPELEDLLEPRDSAFHTNFIKGLTS